MEPQEAIATPTEKVALTTESLHTIAIPSWKAMPTEKQLKTQETTVVHTQEHADRGTGDQPAEEQYRRHKTQ